MKKGLPKKGRRVWTLIFILMTTIIWLYSSITGIVIAFGDATVRYFLGILGTSALISLITCLLGYNGFKIALWLTNIGIIIGLIMMTYAYSLGGPWNNLIGVLDLILFFMIGLLLGGLVQFIKFIFNRKKKGA